MFYLYLKTHNTTGLKYLGQTKNDPFKYTGSGTHWSRHIKKHGYDVTTIILYYTPFIEEIRELGLYYSDLWNIVESNEFANLIPESGEGGMVMIGKTHSSSTKKKIGEGNKGKKRSDDHKEKIRLSQLGKIHSDDHKAKNSLGNVGKKRSDEVKRKISVGNKGKKRSEETKKKISKSKKGKTISAMSEDTKKKISDSKIGKPRSDETKKKLSESLLGIPKPKITCPHCGKTGGINVMPKHHFDNCKLIHH